MTVPICITAFFPYLFDIWNIIADVEMLLPGAHAFRLGLIRNVASEALQVQPNGIDVTLRRVLRVKSAGIVDFDNSMRSSAEVEELKFPVGAESRSNNGHTGQNMESLVNESSQLMNSCRSKRSSHPSAQRCLSRRIQRDGKDAARCHGPTIHAKLCVEIAGLGRSWCHGFRI